LKVAVCAFVVWQFGLGAPVFSNKPREASINGRKIPICSGLYSTHEVKVRVDFNANGWNTEILHAQGDGADAAEWIQDKIGTAEFEVLGNVVRKVR
jgi:hypothetical protein